MGIRCIWRYLASRMGKRAVAVKGKDARTAVGTKTWLYINRTHSQESRLKGLGPLDLDADIDVDGTPLIPECLFSRLIGYV